MTMPLWPLGSGAPAIGPDVEGVCLVFSREETERLRVAREEAAASGGPRRSRERGPQVDAMRVAGRVLRDRQAGARSGGPAVRGGAPAAEGEGTAD